MEPTRAMDIRVQAILDSRSLATVAKYFEDRGIHANSLSDLVRKSIQTIASQAYAEGYPVVSSKPEAHSILYEYAQRGQGFVAHPSYTTDRPVPDPRFNDPSRPYSINPSHPSSIPLTDQHKIEALLKQHPNMSRVRALELVQAIKRPYRALGIDPSLKARIDALDKT